MKRDAAVINCLCELVDVMHVVENIFVVIIAQSDVILFIIAGLDDFNVGRAFRNCHHREDEVAVLVHCLLAELSIGQVALEAFTSLVSAFAHATHVKLCSGVKFIVAAGLNALSINAFVKCVIRAGSAVDDASRKCKIRGSLLESTIQFAFVFCVQAILWRPLCIVQCRHVEAIVVEATTLLRSEVKRLIGAVLDVA